MSVQLKVSNGRLSIFMGQRLVVDKAGGFVDALIDRDCLYALMDDGWVKQYDLRGNFKRDIFSAKAVAIRLVGDVLDITTADGRHQHFRNGRQLGSSGQAFKSKSKTSKSAEDLGARIADWLIEQIGMGLKALVGLIKSKLQK
jgi:hypothetical protein